jgi:hypothetical protein
MSEPEDPTIPTEDATIRPEETPPPAAASPRAQTVTGSVPAGPPPGTMRPGLIEQREPLYRECRGFRLRLEPADLARLRELAGSRGKTDTELGEAFFDGQADRIAAAVSDDLAPPAELRVVVDPYTRQAFVALGNSIRGILSF